MKREIKRLGLFEINSFRMSSGGSTDNTLARLLIYLKFTKVPILPR